MYKWKEKGGICENSALFLIKLNVNPKIRLLFVLILK